MSASMLHENMDISRLMVHSQQVEESLLRKSKGKLRRQDLLKMLLPRVCLTFKTSLSLRKGFQYHVPSNVSNTGKVKVSNPKPQKRRNIYPPKERPTCSKCGKKHVDECLVGTNSFYG